jgi:hypothetical protein
MLDASTMMDLTLHRGDKRRGQDPEHRQNPQGDLAYNIPPSCEHSQGQDEEDL